MKLLITGATGQLGIMIVNNVLKQIASHDIAVSVRDAKKAEELKEKGVDVREASFDNKASLISAFQDVEKLLIISTDGDNETRIRQHLTAVSAAKEVGVKWIGYTSVVNASQSSLSLATVHRATEEAIKATGIAYTFFRNNWYLENEATSILGLKQGAPWLSTATSGKVGWALRSDYAEAIAHALLSQEILRPVYELSGKLRTQEELTTLVGKVIGQEVKPLFLDEATYRESLTTFGLPEFVVELLVGIQIAIEEGALAVDSQDLELLLGRAVTPLEVGIERMIG